MDDFEIPISDALDFDLSDSTEFPEAEMIEPVSEVSDEISLEEEGASFQEPEFSEIGSEDSIEAAVDVDPTDEFRSVDIDSNLSESEQVELPVYDEPTAEIPQEEINSLSDKMGSETIPEAEEFISETTYEQEPESDVIVPETTPEYIPEGDDSLPETIHTQEPEADNSITETTSEQAPEVEESAIERTPEQVTEDDQPDPKAAPEIIHAEDEVRPEALEPNIVYERNGYEYKTDELGRTQLVTGDLDLTEGNRTPLQTEVGHMGVDGDEGGHLIGTRFNGPTDAFNLVPQDANLNRGEWKAMENSWADGMSNGQEVKVMVEPVYGDNSIRPESFEVLSQVDGELTYTSFLNQPSSKTKGEKIG